MKINLLPVHYVKVDDPGGFLLCFSPYNYTKLRNLKNELSNHNKRKLIYEDRYVSEMNVYDALFSSIDFTKNSYFSIIDKYLNDFNTTGYDRHSSFGRKINTIYRNFRLQKDRTLLPSEIIDYIDDNLSKDISKGEGYSILSALHRYLSYKDVAGVINKTKKYLKDGLTECGLNEDQFDKIETIVAPINNDINMFMSIYKRCLDLDSKLGGGVPYDTNKINSQIKDKHLSRRERIKHYIRNIINNKVVGSYTSSIETRQIASRLSKALHKSKKAYKTFDELRRDEKYFKTILNLISVWIMELDDASRIMPLLPNLFDYLILDEASQCNIAYTLPSMFRSKKVIFVGDSEQMRDNTILFKSNRVFDELAKRYKIEPSLQIKATGDSVQSVLDIANLRGYRSVVLHNHYRSPAEIIGFSNQYFYKPNGKELIPLNNSYLPYFDTDCIMLLHYSPAKMGNEKSDNTNETEANNILTEFNKELILSFPQKPTKINHGIG